jgi:hypothetical protein
MRALLVDLDSQASEEDKLHERLQLKKLLLKMMHH